MQSTQKQLTEIDRRLLQGFKTTSNLSASLSKPPKTKTMSPFLLLSGGEKVKKYVEEAEIEKKSKISKINEVNLNIENEVKTLGRVKVGEPCLRTEEMIRKQKESRRKRHIDFLKDFEKVVENMEKGGEENEKKVTVEIEAFFRNSDKEISSYLENLTDGELLSREDEFLGELENFMMSHKNKRNEKLFNYYAVIKAIEGDRMTAVNQISKKLFNDLFETAFILEEEINVLIDERKKKLEENFNAFVDKNRVKMEGINAMRNESFQNFEKIMMEKDQSWRVLKHDQAILKFRTDIQNLTFVNPPERVKLYESLKIKILKYFELKKNRLEVLLQRKDLKILKTEMIDKFNEEFNGLVDRINLKYDNFFDKLLKHHEHTQQEARIKLAQLSSRLRFLSAIDNIEDVLAELAKLINKLDDEGKDLMTKTIKFVEENEVRLNDIILNISSFVAKIAGKMEEHRRETRSFDKNYELEKAKIADSNDETLDHFNQTFSNMKLALQQSVHHPQLQENLEKCFTTLDEIEQEYRLFHNHNLELAKCHPASISSLFQKFQNDFAIFFSLLDSSSLEQLNARNLEKAKKKAHALYEEEEAQKLKEEERQMEELKKKGGKVPPKPKKDPKKAALEQEARLKELMEKVGVEQVKKFETKLGGVFIESINMTELTRKFYHPHEDQPNEVEIQAIPEEQIVDFLPESPLDPEGRNILDKNIIFSVGFVQSFFTSFRNSLFEYLFDFQNDNLNNASNTDKEFIEESIEILDERLKLHYPLKGRLETEDFATRSSQITEHKKRYERHTRTTLEKANDQTDHFNYLLEAALNEAKEYESDQNKLRETLGSVMSLPKLQGLQNTVRENVFKFEEKIREFEKQLKNLSENEINNLLNANSRLISGSKPISETGTFSSEEIQWYKVMLEEIDKQLLSQQEIKKAKTKDIIEFISKKKQEALEIFEKNYTTALEELACREGTGKKYGRPRRLYQERLRMEMTKCEKAQEAMTTNLETLRKLYESFKLEISKPDSETLSMEKNKTLSIRIRRIMMKIRTCMGRYQSHILALKPDNKSTEMPRVTYNEYKFDITVENDQIEKDKQLKEEELEELGPLFYQKDNRNFNEYVLEIEKLVKEEAQKIYIGPAAKFLSGADKIPDYLRNYLENNRRNVEDFRIGCIRQLRNSVDEFSKLTPMISEMILISIKFRYEIWLRKEQALLETSFYQEKKKNEETKQILEFKLRPNLSNPSCKDELDLVIKAEKDRFLNMKAETSKYLQKRLDSEFSINNEFFKVFLNNTEFLLVLYDNMLLFEDFVKLPGDEDIVKKHDNLKTLLKRKQKGALIDTSSERSLIKVWPGFLIDSFRIDERKIEYIVQNPVLEKKDVKNAKKDEPEQVIKDTKEIKTFKTFRQKSVISFRNKLFAELKNRFDEEISILKAEIDKIQYEEDKYQFFWEQKVDSLNNK